MVLKKQTIICYEFPDLARAELNPSRFRPVPVNHARTRAAVSAALGTGSLSRWSGRFARGDGALARQRRVGSSAKPAADGAAADRRRKSGHRRVEPGQIERPVRHAVASAEEVDNEREPRQRCMIVGGDKDGFRRLEMCEALPDLVRHVRSPLLDRDSSPDAVLSPCPFRDLIRSGAFPWALRSPALAVAGPEWAAFS